MHKHILQRDQAALLIELNPHVGGAKTGSAFERALCAPAPVSPPSATEQKHYQKNNQQSVHIAPPCLHLEAGWGPRRNARRQN